MTAAQAGAVWAAVVPAAGSARRMGFDKTLALIEGVPVLARTLLLLRRAGLRQIVVGVRDEATVRARALTPFGLTEVGVVPGGATRSATVARCLEQLPADTTHVLVHDGARPHCSAELVRAVMVAAEGAGAAAAALPIFETVHRVGEDGCISATLDRERLWRAQTPQAFEVGLLRRAHAAASPGSDDAGMVAALGVPVRVVEGEHTNVKLTVAEDMAPPPGTQAPSVAVGFGQDIHRLVAGRRLVLGGVEIPFERGLLGHSDADVLSHALADAVLGAAGRGDIGQHFPPGDPAYLGADSLTLLARCRLLAAEAGWRPFQADCLVLAERPHLAPYAEAMRRTLAAVLEIDPLRCNVKAGTNEGLGPVGRGEGVEAQAVVLLVRAPAR